MRILVIGGSSFVGRHIVQHALDRGHEVTLFNRGQTDPGAFPAAEHLTGDRNSDLSALDGRSWDATVDVCAYVPRQVRTLLETLGTRGGHYTFISTVSVYGDVVARPQGDSAVEQGFDEAGAPLLEPAWDDELEMEKYGQLKVACEQVARELAGDRLLVVRPGYVIGPHDPTHRFTYWVERVADGRSPMAGPDAEQPLQGVDARDLGAFTVSQVERGAVDTFHVTAPEPAPTFAEWLQRIADAEGVPLPEVQWVGPQPGLPLAAPKEFWPTMRAGLTHARSAGFTWRPIEDTVRDTLTWVRSARAAGTYVPRPGVGLTPQAEADLLAAAAAGS
ncbi:MAG TPA: NAD-dependent epimerase/dehydratase family protein [Mycobacteriales bacterium]|nr:NAD-dependent epimerase/dehydratase family protein [Mycobacteriales bacterium]